MLPQQKKEKEMPGRFKGKLKGTLNEFWKGKLERPVNIFLKASKMNSENEPSVYMQKEHYNYTLNKKMFWKGPYMTLEMFFETT